MSLNTVLEKIKELQPFADEDVENGSRATLAGRRGRKNRAIESLKDLRDEYTNDLRRTAAFILVVGDKRDEFVNIANEHFKCFSTNPETFYNELVDRIPSSVYTREGLSSLFDILGRHIEDKMLAFRGQGVRAYNQLIFRQEYGRTIKTREDFLLVVKQALIEQVGGEIVGIQAVYSLTSEAIKRNHTAKFTPILLPATDEKFALTVATDLERISNRVFIVVAGETLNPTNVAHDEVLTVKEPDNDSVKKALKTISNQLKK